MARPRALTAEMRDRVLRVLEQRRQASAEPVAIPSNARLARQLGVSRATIQRFVASIKTDAPQ